MILITDARQPCLNVKTLFFFLFVATFSCLKCHVRLPPIPTLFPQVQKVLDIEDNLGTRIRCMHLCNRIRERSRIWCNLPSLWVVRCEFHTTSRLHKASVPGEVSRRVFQRVSVVRMYFPLPCILRTPRECLQVPDDSRPIASRAKCSYIFDPNRPPCWRVRLYKHHVLPNFQSAHTQ